AKRPTNDIPRAARVAHGRVAQHAILHGERRVAPRPCPACAMAAVLRTSGLPSDGPRGGREDSPDTGGCMRLDLVLRAALAAGVLILEGWCASRNAPTSPNTGGTPAGTTAADTVLLLEDLSSRQVFPTDNWWNLDVSQAPVDPRSQAII